jgi:hypothetical protein
MWWQFNTETKLYLDFVLQFFQPQYSFFTDMYNPKNNPFRVPMDNDIFTLRERERDAKLQVLKLKKLKTFYIPHTRLVSCFQLDKNAEK